MAPRFSGTPFLQHPIPAAPCSCSMGCWLPQAMAGSGKRLNSEFPTAGSDLRSVGGAGRGKQACLVPPGRQVTARNGAQRARQVPARCTAGSCTAMLGGPPYNAPI